MEKILKCYLSEIYLNNTLIIPEGDWERMDRKGKKWRIPISDIYAMPQSLFVCRGKYLTVWLDKAGHPEHFGEWKSTKVEMY